MRKNKILVTLSTFCELDPTPRNLLIESEFDFNENTTGKRITPDELIKKGTDWAGLIAGIEPYTSETLSQLKQLRCISRVGVGIDAIDLTYAAENNIVVRNTPQAPTLAVTEMTIAQIFCLLKQVIYHNTLMKNKIWKRKFGTQIKGKTLGIIGVGRIGKSVAKFFSFLGLSLLGYDHTIDESWARTVGLSYCSLTYLLKNSDIISLHISAIKGPKPLIGKKEIRMMKEGSILINTSRGNAIDYDALFDGLKSGHISGAGLDVYPEEPYSGNLCELDNVILTPHISTLTKETRIDMEINAVKNCLDELRKY